MLENGLIQIELTNPAAAEATLINGKPLDDNTQVLRHLDTIHFGRQSG